MGAVLNKHESDQFRFNVPDRSLSNQTFRIQDKQYTMLHRLGGGAFGHVYSAVSSQGQPAAIKAIDVTGNTTGNQFDPHTLIDSYQKEIRMLFKMRKETQHVVTIYGFDFDPRSGLALMAMELGGDTLTKRIEKLHFTKGMQIKRHHADGSFAAASRDYISSPERKNIWVQLVNIVQTLHRHHVVHRDVKPDNLVFFGPIMKIVDLGIAQKEVRGYDPGVDGIGTKGYSAPECFRRGAHVTSKADIWSAGAILYHMTYGIPALAETPHPPYNLPPTRSSNVQDILHQCLQHNVHQRGSHSWLARHPYTVDPRAF